MFIGWVQVCIGVCVFIFALLGQEGCDELVGLVTVHVGNLLCAVEGCGVSVGSVMSCRIWLMLFCCAEDAME